MLVKFRPTTNRSSILGRELVNLRAGQNLPILAQQTGVDTTVVETFDNLGVTVLEINSNDSVPHAVHVFSEFGAIEYAEPDFLYQLHDTGPPADPFFKQPGQAQWGLDNDGAVDVPGDANYPTGIAGVDSKACLAWGTAAGTGNNVNKGAGAIICVIDTGTRTTHNDIAGNLWVNPAETPGDLLDNDNNGYVDDINGVNTSVGALTVGDLTDDNGHGTNVAGIAMADENAFGVVGVAPEAQLMTIKVSNDQNSFVGSSVIRGIEYATAQAAAGQPVRVINMSLGGNDPSRAMKDAIDAAGAQNILVVVSAGNENFDLGTNPRYPAVYTSANLMVVGAHSPYDTRAGFSNTGDLECDIFAPGGDSNLVNNPPGNVLILGPARTGDSDVSLFGGTSQASPHVAGAAALLYANNTGITYSEVRKRLMESAAAGLNNYNTICLSGGRLDLNAALTVNTANTIFVDGATPNGGRTGSQIVIEGVGFGATQGTGQVEINVGGIDNATITSWSENRIECTVPTLVNAGTGVGTIRVLKDGGTASNTVPFTTNGAAVVYQVTQVAHAPVDVSGVAADATLSGLAGAFSAKFELMAFDFDFYGTTLQSGVNFLQVTAFGLAQFDVGASALNNTSLPTDAAPNSLLAPLWGLLHPTANTEVRISNPAGGPMVIEWRNIGFGLPIFSGNTFIGTGAVGEGTFQLELQADDDILMHYIDVDFGHPDGDGGSDLTVGVENAAGDEGTQWNQPVTNGMSLQFRATP